MNIKKNIFIEIIKEGNFYMACVSDSNGNILYNTDWYTYFRDAADVAVDYIGSHVLTS